VSGAIIRDGHWRRRDPLHGVSPPMRAALLAFRNDDLGRREAGRGLHVGTVRALATRGLLRRDAGPEGLSPAFALTREGHAALAEIDRRAAARRRLIEERPARAATPRNI
jgi:hypothetical protein